MLRHQHGGVARRTSRRTARRSVVLAAGLLTAGLLVPSGAAAKSFTVGYDFGNDRAGNAGWVPDNSPAPAEDPAGGDWYRSTFATGGGLRIVPKGNGDAPYKDVRGTWWYYAPSGSTIKRARVEGLNGRAVDRQIARAWLFDLRPDPPLPRPSNVSREIREAGTGPTTWNNTTFTLAPSAGMTSGGFGLWLYANPCGPDQDGGTCTPVGPDSEAFISLRKLTMTLDDPTKATTKVDGLGDGTLWTNTNGVDLKVASSDPQSGIAKIQAEVQTPTGTRKLALGEWRPDTLNSTARGPGVPPLAIDRSAARAITAASKGRTRVTIRTTNGAGATTVSRGAVRVDREKPTVTFPKTLKLGSTIALRDADSGVADAQLTIAGKVVKAQCSTGAKRCSVKLPGDTPSRAVVEVRVTDVAGNVKTTSKRAAKNDNAAPGASVGPKRPSILDGSMQLDLTDTPASEYVWFGIFAKPDHADDEALDSEEGLVLAAGSVRGGAVRTVTPTTTDPDAVSFTARRNGVLNVTVIARSAGRLTARPAVWFLRPAAFEARARSRGVSSLMSVRARHPSPAASVADRSRPLPSDPKVGGVSVPKGMVRPKVELDFGKLSVAAAPPTESNLAGPTGASGLTQIDSDGDPFQPGKNARTEASATLVKTADGGPGPGWRKLKGGRQEFIDDYDYSQLPPEATRGVCNAGTRGKDGFGTGVWQYRAGQNVWFPVKGVQTVRDMNYTLTLKMDELTGSSGAVALGGKVKGVDIGGSVTVTKSDQKSFSVFETFRNAKRRRVVQIPVVYRTFHWKIGCQFNSQTKRYAENYEFQEAVPTRIGKVGLRADPTQSLPFVPCDRGIAGRSSKHYGGTNGSSRGFDRSRSTTYVRDVSASIGLKGLGVKVGLNTGQTTTVSEHVELFGRKPFRACTWKNVPAAKNGDPAWEEHPEETWLWDR